LNENTATDVIIVGNTDSADSTQRLSFARTNRQTSLNEAPVSYPGDRLDPRFL
jgi:hypothetical protein